MDQSAFPSPRGRSRVCAVILCHVMETSAAQEAAWLGAKPVTLGRWPGTSLVRCVPQLPVLSKLVLSAGSTGGNGLCLFLQPPQPGVACPHPSAAVPELGCLRVQCPPSGGNCCLGWVLLTLSSLAGTGCSTTTFPSSLEHSAIKPALKRVSLV